MMTSLFCTLVLFYMCIEVCFALLFHFYLVPRANQRTEPQPYRDYGNDRDVMLTRVVDRMKKTFPEKQDFQRAVVSFLQEWCEPVDRQQQEPLQAAAAAKMVEDVNRLNAKGLDAASPSSFRPPRPLRLSRESMSTTATSSDGGDDDDEESSLSLSSFDEMDAITSRCQQPEEISSGTTTSSSSDDDEIFIVPDIGKAEMDIFIAWALFEKEPSQLVDWEQKVLAKCYHQAQQDHRIGFAPGYRRRFKPRRLSLEDVKALWRPLGVYVFFWVLTVVGAIVLRAAGFQRVVSQRTGVTGWFRPAAVTTTTTTSSSSTKQPSAQSSSSSPLLPLLFFHGIAPAGVFFYIPMILLRLANEKDRAVMMFDNSNISCALGFGALREAETVQGVMELVDRYLPDATGLSLCGHSFGSCPLTWLLHSPPALRRRIKQFVLLDPVTILLSEPDVMANFLYSTGCNTIRMMAGSELFTEYYLRRHFAWYNSELWLDDIFDSRQTNDSNKEDDSIQVLIALSERDEIVNAPKVKRHIDSFLSGDQNKSQSSLSSSCKVLLWKRAGHAKCVTSPSKWTEIKQAMLEQELKIARRMSKTYSNE